MDVRNPIRIAVAGAAAYAAEPVWAAAQGGGESGLGVAGIALLAVGAAVILFQAVPAAVLLGSMLREIFGGAPRKARQTQELS